MQLHNCFIANTIDIKGGARNHILHAANKLGWTINVYTKTVLAIIICFDAAFRTSIGEFKNRLAAIAAGSNWPNNLRDDIACPTYQHLIA